MEEMVDHTHNSTSGELPSAVMVLLAVVGFAIVGSALGLFIFQGLCTLFDWPSDFMYSGRIGADADFTERQSLRTMLLLSQLGTFLFAGWATSWLFYRRGSALGGASAVGWAVYLKADYPPNLLVLFTAMLIMIVGAPFVLWLYEINQAIPLPDNLRGIESQAEELLKGLLRMDTPFEFWFNLLLIALVPAVGEEWVFRGIVQQQTMRIIRNPVAAILLTAAVFSFIHMQFEGFLPRMWLGFVLGWLYWQTQNFWIPAGAHFANNGMQVVGQYLFQKQISNINLEEDHHIPWYAALASLLLVLWLANSISKNIRQA